MTFAGVALNTGSASARPATRAAAPSARFHAPSRASGRASSSAAAMKCRMPNQMKRGPEHAASCPRTPAAPRRRPRPIAGGSRTNAGLERHPQHQADADEQQELRHDRGAPAHPRLIDKHPDLHPAEVIQVVDEVVDDHLRDGKAAQHIDQCEPRGAGRGHRWVGPVDDVRCYRARIDRADGEALFVKPGATGRPGSRGPFPVEGEGCRNVRRACCDAAALIASSAIAWPACAIDLQGHRGARGLAPENTLAAFRAALGVGVTTLETDLALTADDTAGAVARARPQPGADAHGRRPLAAGRRSADPHAEGVGPGGLRPRPARSFACLRTVMAATAAGRWRASADPGAALRVGPRRRDSRWPSRPLQHRNQADAGQRGADRLGRGVRACRRARDERCRHDGAGDCPVLRLAVAARAASGSRPPSGPSA